MANDFINPNFYNDEVLKKEKSDDKNEKLNNIISLEEVLNNDSIVKENKLNENNDNNIISINFPTYVKLRGTPSSLEVSQEILNDKSNGISLTA